MPSVDPELTTHIGIILRKHIAKHKKATGESYIKLSERIGRDANYIASYMVRDPNDWSIPKFPTMDSLLDAIGLTSEKLIKEASARSRKEAREQVSK